MKPQYNSCLDIAEEQFQSLASDPETLTINAASLSRDMPNREIPIGELRKMLLTPGCEKRVVDAAWCHLTRMAQTVEGPWTTVAVGMMTPGLKRIGSRLGPCFPGDPADLDSEVLAAFLDALRKADPVSPGLANHLHRAASRGARRTCRIERKAVGRRLPAAESCYSRAGNPDLALARAVLDGVVTPRQANLVSGVLLDRDHRADIARRLGLSRRNARTQLASARRELAAYLAA